jgi:hypothetical protein
MAFESQMTLLALCLGPRISFGSRRAPLVSNISSLQDGVLEQAVLWEHLAPDTGYDKHINANATPRVPCGTLYSDCTHIAYGFLRK